MGLHFYEMSRVVRFINIEAESSVVVARGWESEGCGIRVKGDRASAGEDEEVWGWMG